MLSGQLFNPRDLANQKECTQALTVISSQTLNLNNLLIVPFSHHAPLHTNNPPLLICTPSFSRNHGIAKNTLFTPMTGSRPKISQNKVESLSRSPSTPINHLLVSKWKLDNPPNSTIFYQTLKHSHLYLQTTLFTPSPPQTPLNALTCRKPQKTPINLSEGKSLCALFSKPNPRELMAS